LREIHAAATSAIVNHVSQPTPASDRKASGTLFGFRMLGIPVRFHFTFHILVILLLSAGMSAPEYISGYWLYLIGLFASAMLHEAAHMLAGRCFGARTAEMVMYPLGGQFRFERALKPVEELCVSLSGPLVNLALAVGISQYLTRTHQAVEVKFSALIQPTDDSVLARLALANLLIASFNLLPAFPMDGGHILRALLGLMRRETQAARAATWAGRMLAITLGLYGLLAQQYILVFFFAPLIYLGAARESTATENRVMTSGVPVRSAMIREFHKLTHGDTIRDAANLLLATAQKDFPVLHGESVVGLLSRGLLLRALARQGPNTYVAGVMDREFLRLEAEMELADALALIAPSGPCALVMDGDNLVGLLSSDNLSEFVLFRRFGIGPSASNGAS
jgi:Zn-dependent protease/CBS domain-containing protein